MHPSIKQLVLWTSLACSAFALVGCSSNEQGKPITLEAAKPKPVPMPPAAPQTAPRRAARLHFEPIDLSSNYSGAIRVVLAHDDRPPAEGLLEMLAARTRLELEPEGTPVTVTVSTRAWQPLPVIDRPDPIPGGPLPPPGPSWEERQPRSFVELTPVGQLAPRWYRIVIDGLVPGLRADPSPAVAREGERLYARFNPASAPVLRHVRICNKGNGKTAAVAEYSEEVGASPEEDALELGDERAVRRCKHLVTDAQRAGKRGARRFYYDCSGIPRTEGWRLAFRDSVFGATGVRVKLPLGRTRGEFKGKVQDLPKDHAGCSIWRQ